MQATARLSEYQDWITITFLLCFCLLVLARISFPQRFEEFISLLNSGKFISFKGKENKAFHGFNIILFMMQTLVVSLFLYLCYSYFYPGELSPLVLYIRIFTGYTCFIMLKAGVEKIIGNVFDIDDRIDYYIFQKLSYRNFISLFLLFASLLLVYSIEVTALSLSIIAITAILSNAIAMIIIYRRNQSALSVNWFYFILYICALEIAPYIILYKLITN